MTTNIEPMPVLRAGYPGPRGLLILIPLVNLAFIYFLAFSRWPVEEGRRE